LLNFNTYLLARNVLSTFITKDTKDASEESAEKVKTYLYAVYDTLWLQPVRQFVSSRWQVKDFNLCSMVTQWSHIMPDEFVDKLVLMYIKPRLEREVTESTDFATSLQSVGQWLTNWRELLGLRAMREIFKVSVKI